jgi:hypothetical protein
MVLDAVLLFHSLVIGVSVAMEQKVGINPLGLFLHLANPYKGKGKDHTKFQTLPLA